TIAVPQKELNKLPRKERLEIRNEASQKLLLLALIFLAIITLRFIASYFQTVLTSYFSQKAMADLRHDVFGHLQKMPTKFFDQNPVGRLVTRVTNDIRAIDEMLASGVITLIQDIILIFTIVILMLVLNWRLALVSFSIIPLVIWVIVIFRKKTRVIYRQVRTYLAALNATLAEHIAGQKIIQLFNQYFHKRQEFANINQQYYLASISQIRLFAFFRPIIHVSSQIAVALIIWYGGGQILQNVITIGLLMAFTQYINKLFEPINDFSEKFNILQGAMASAERIFALLEVSPDDYRIQKHRGLKLNGEIEFDHIWLAYNEEEWVLKDVSFKIKAGEKIALVGHTGSGKTSIVNLILNMYPYQKGRILIDGKELHDYSLEDIRKNVGIVQQDVFIFAGTIKDNIALGNKEISEEEIIQIAKYVNADKFISQLPQRYNEPVMERGATLSTGQRQLIAFARVLAYNPSIFILD
ncbi:MAG TPA: ABC transporter ATP-binding protein, partial [Candidatus Cloacimonas sp.]|nr:ABC transporter ATP-binding protein [Candidatus Cloacimonas sp.]